MSNHGLFVVEPALALALAAKMARRSLTSAARRAIAKRLAFWCRSAVAAVKLGTHDVKLAKLVVDLPVGLL